MLNKPEVQVSADVAAGNQKITPITLTINKGVEASNISRTQVYELLKQGKLEAIKSGRRTLLIYDSLVAYLAGLPRYEGGK